MLYLIKSPKWTEHYKKDTYWAPNRCGYVSIIADAGFYTEEEMLDITRTSSKNDTLAVPVTEEILELATKQCKEKEQQLKKDLEIEKEQYNSAVAYLKQQQERNQDRYVLLAALKTSVMEESTAKEMKESIKASPHTIYAETERIPERLLQFATSTSKNGYKGTVLELVKTSEQETDLDLLEQIYKKVPLDGQVKFNGKAYVRCRPVKNKYLTIPYHFRVIDKDIYSRNIQTWDGEESVNLYCEYKAVIKR